MAPTRSSKNAQVRAKSTTPTRSTHEGGIRKNDQARVVVHKAKTLAAKGGSSWTSDEREELIRLRTTTRTWNEVENITKRSNQAVRLEFKKLLAGDSGDDLRQKAEDCNKGRGEKPPSKRSSTRSSTNLAVGASMATSDPSSIPSRIHCLVNPVHLNKSKRETTIFEETVLKTTEEIIDSVDEVVEPIKHRFRKEGWRETSQPRIFCGQVYLHPYGFDVEVLRKPAYYRKELPRGFTKREIDAFMRLIA